MQDEGRKVHGNEAVQSDDGRLASLERENHVPDGSSIKRGKSGAKAPWGPVQNGHCDDIRESAEPAK